MQRISLKIKIELYSIWLLECIVESSNSGKCEKTRGNGRAVKLIVRKNAKSCSQKLNGFLHQQQASLVSTANKPLPNYKKTSQIFVTLTCSLHLIADFLCGTCFQRPTSNLHRSFSFLSLYPTIKPNRWVHPINGPVCPPLLYQKYARVWGFIPGLPHVGHHPCLTQPSLATESSPNCCQWPHFHWLLLLKGRRVSWLQHFSEVVPPALTTRTSSLQNALPPPPSSSYKPCLSS